MHCVSDHRDTQPCLRTEQGQATSLQVVRRAEERLAADRQVVRIDQRIYLKGSHQYLMALEEGQ
jgi:hypothetical protein